MKGGTHEEPFSASERDAALIRAASVLRDRQPQRQVMLRVRQEYSELDAVAVWLWPGVVRVSLRYTGQLVAQSLPGQPFTRDTQA